MKSEKWAWFTERGWVREGDIAQTLLVAVRSKCNLKRYIARL